MEAIETSQGMTTQDIADHIGRDRSKASLWLKKLYEKGKINKQRVGRGDVWVSKTANLGQENDMEF
jgi:predicted transcriptional regulator